VYKSVLFPSFQVVADKVVVVASQEKSSQIMRELQSLRTLLDDGHPYCKNVVRLLDVYPNPRYLCVAITEARVIDTSIVCVETIIVIVIFIIIIINLISVWVFVLL
jgi:hypothetical protein